MKILIVDDDAPSRKALELTLRALGHQVFCADCGEEGLNMLSQCEAQAIISDQLMPGLDGLEFCRRVRQADRPHYTYFILLTAVEGKAGYLAGMEAGADDFITKPFDRELLAARLVVAQRVLSLQSDLRQLTGLLPICSLCKRVRDDRNYWHQVESYISEHSEARFTHSYCPECFKKLLTQVEALTPSL